MTQENKTIEFIMKHKVLIITAIVFCIALGVAIETPSEDVSKIENPALKAVAQTIIPVEPIDPISDTQKLTTLSPYSAEGDALYTRICDSEHFFAVLEESRRLSQLPEAPAQTHITYGTMLALASWDEKDPTKQLQLYTDADAAYDKALKIDAVSYTHLTLPTT